MRLVPHAATFPHRCAVIPFKGNSNSRGFVDTGVELQGGRDSHVYVSIEAVEAMARLIPGGWQPGHVTVGKNRRIDELLARLAAVEADLAAARGQLEAVQVLKNGGFTQARPPGRPKTRAVA